MNTLLAIALSLTAPDAMHFESDATRNSYMACSESICLEVRAWALIAHDMGCELEATDYGYVVQCGAQEVLGLVMNE